MNAPLDVEALARGAKKASRVLAAASGDLKNRALREMAVALKEGSIAILDANRADAVSARAAGRTSAFVDRLSLDDKRIDALVRRLLRVAALPDPVGRVTDYAARPNGLRIRRMRVPLGVLAVLYEAEPGVASDAAGLCVKSGNAVLLRPGKEALLTGSAVASALQEGLRRAGLPLGSIGLIRDTDRGAFKRLLGLEGLVDLVIPRGGAELAATTRLESDIPVLAYGRGVCHVYVDEAYEPGVAEAVCLNAKLDRPQARNAMETLLVHAAAAPRLLPRLAERLGRAGVDLRADPKALRLLPGAKPAKPADWDTEHRDLTLSIKVVGSLQEAILHIAHHGTGLAEAIVTSDPARAERFQREVDAGAVFANASTRLADGGEFGMGADLGWSTQKLHARGPVGLVELTCEKFVATGTGQARGSRRVRG